MFSLSSTSLWAAGSMESAGATVKLNQIFKEEGKMGFQMAEDRKQLTHSCLESLWCSSDGDMALPLILHGYCVLASNLNSPDPWLGVMKWTESSSLHSHMSTLFFFPSQSLWGIIVPASPILMNSSKMRTVSSIRSSSPVDGVQSFFQTRSSLIVGISVLYVILGSSQKEQMIPFHFSPIHPTMVPTSLHSSNSYW